MSILTFPHSIDAERAYLGAVLLESDRAKQMDALEEMNPEDYFSAAHRELHALMLAMVRKGRVVDIITISDAMMSGDRAENMGGMAYVQGLPERVPTTLNIAGYRKQIQAKALRRRVIVAANALTAAAQSDEMTEDEVLEVGESHLASLRAGQQSATFVLAPQMFVNAWDDAEARWTALDEGKPPGFSTPWPALTEVLVNLDRQKLVFIGARPAMGKSALAAQLAAHIADQQGPHGAGVAMFSLEMDHVELAHRAVSAETEINGLHIAQGLRTQENRSKYAQGASALGERLLLAVDDSPQATLGRIRSQARRINAAMRGRLGAIFVDYLQLMDTGGGRESMHIRLGEVSRGLKVLAREMNVMVVCLSQLSRECEKRASKRPQMSDLRDSGSIEADADAIMFLYRDEYYEPKTTPDPGCVEIIIAKQRRGPTQIVKLGWEGQYTRIVDNPPPRASTWGR